LSIQSNDFRGNISINKCQAQTYISNAAVTLSQNISNNTFTNLNVNTTGDITFISNNVTVPATGNQDVNSNSIVGTLCTVLHDSALALFTSSTQLRQ
jgi:hypothetical protein